jgi:predicted RNase H-like HicB family nuclease
MTARNVLHAVIHCEDGSMWAEVLEHGGLFASGDDYDELLESIEDGLSLLLGEQCHLQWIDQPSSVGVSSSGSEERELVATAPARN